MVATQKCQLLFVFVLLAGALLLSGVSNELIAQTPPLQPTGYFDRSEIIMVWDEGTTNGAHIHEKNLKLKFNYQGFELKERLTGGDRVISDTTLSFDQRQIDLVSGDFNGDNILPTISIPLPEITTHCTWCWPTGVKPSTTPARTYTNLTAGY
jgi:hypothetical protein